MLWHTANGLNDHALQKLCSQKVFKSYCFSLCSSHAAFSQVRDVWYEAGTVWYVDKDDFIRGMHWKQHTRTHYSMHASYKYILKNI